MILSEKSDFSRGIDPVWMGLSDNVRILFTYFIKKYYLGGKQVNYLIKRAFNLGIGGTFEV